MIRDEGRVPAADTNVVCTTSSVTNLQPRLLHADKEAALYASFAMSAIIKYLEMLFGPHCLEVSAALGEEQLQSRYVPRKWNRLAWVFKRVLSNLTWEYISCMIS